MSMVLGSALLTIVGVVPTDARVFEKLRSDGVTVICVRHDEKPTIFTPLIECKPASGWVRATESSLRGRRNQERMPNPEWDFPTTPGLTTPRASSR